MSKPAVSLFMISLVLLTVFSMLLGSAGIDRLRYRHYPPFSPEGDLGTPGQTLCLSSDSMIFFFDTIQGKIFFGTIAAAALLVSTLLCFRSRHRVLGLAILASVAIPFIIVGVNLFLYAEYQTHPH